MRAFAAMTPTRVPVKDPGPVPMAIKSRAISKDFQWQEGGLGIAYRRNGR